MPGAIIVADQARPGPSTSPGSPGVARTDLWVGREVTLLDGAGGNNQWDWSFLSIEPGSAVQLSGADDQGVAHTSSATWTPDLPGTYRVRLQTNGGGPGNVQILVFRVRFDEDGNLANDGWILPGHGEVAGQANYPGNTRDWAEVFDFIFADARARLRALEARTLSPSTFVVPGFLGVAATQVTDAGGEGIGCLTFDPSAYRATTAGLTRVLVFSAVLEATAGMTAEVRLYNRTTGQYVTGTTLTATGPGAQAVVSAALTVGASPALPNAAQLYEVRLRISVGAPGLNDFAVCKNAVLEVRYT